MTRPGEIIVIEAPVLLHVAPAGDIIALDLWSGTVPDLGVRTLQVEPRRWWLFGGGSAANIAARIDDTGALAPIGGGLVRATFTGSAWRALLMVSSFFDAENPAFGPGDVAATVIHHVPVWIAPVATDVCEVYFAASYAHDLVGLWTRSMAFASPDSHDDATMTGTLA
jgi:sarcosine oxidase gamma subunit